MKKRPTLKSTQRMTRKRERGRETKRKRRGRGQQRKAAKKMMMKRRRDQRKKAAKKKRMMRMNTKTRKVWTFQRSKSGPTTSSPSCFSQDYLIVYKLQIAFYYTSFTSSWLFQVCSVSFCPD